MTRVSSSKRFKPSKETPKATWRTKRLDFETTFDIEGTFRHNNTTEWAVLEFDRRRLSCLFRPAAEVAYPRIVRLFYQNMEWFSDAPKILATTIDGVRIHFGVLDIAQALGCSHLCPTDLLAENGELRFGKFPEKPTVHSIVKDMCAGKYGDKKKKNCASKSSLPKAMWFFDQVLKRNVHPIGHKVQRGQEFLLALYATHTGVWFSVPALIFNQMHKYRQHLVASGDPNAKKWKLPFPYLITQLLVLRRFVVDNDEISEAQRVTFGLAQWNLSLSHMPNAKKEGDGMAAGDREDVNALVEDIVGRSEEQIVDGASYEIAQAVSPHAEESAG
ncbi:uncharacterized protein LOC132282705 isoform X1 [Cornus florida]|uniref:uncharacterized protein LOC132282705 isoform X1 n=1 Tax=Cornus florida TaxID=4283 RepID=UPI0028A004BB|nr:uncharacterized protein LOC132282705 isoform X1 [Cornus florida]